MTYTKRVFLVGIMNCLPAMVSFAGSDPPAKTIVINSNTAAEINLSSYLAVIEGNYSFAQISSGKYDSLYSENLIKNKSGEINYTDCWAQIKITSDADRITNWILKTDKLY